MSGIAKTQEGRQYRFVDEIEAHQLGPQGNTDSTSKNDNHGEDSTTGMGGSTTGKPAPSAENLSHGKEFYVCPIEKYLTVGR